MKLELRVLFLGLLLLFVIAASCQQQAAAAGVGESIHYYWANDPQDAQPAETAGPVGSAEAHLDAREAGAALSARREAHGHASGGGAGGKATND